MSIIDTYKNKYKKFLSIPAYYYLKNSPSYKYWKVLEKSQYLTTGELEAIQWNRLINMLNYIYCNNTFYKKVLTDSNIHPLDIKSYNDIKKIPIITKEEIRNAKDNIISRGYEKNQLIMYKTGGSTGTSLEGYITEECSELRNSCTIRHDRWSGWDVGDSVGAVWGNIKKRATIKEILKELFLTKYIFLDTMNVNELTVIEFANRWQKVKPSLLFGHAHSLYLLAQYVSDLNLSVIKPKGIISSSMTLMDYERNTIENVFGAQVYDRYGCEEVGLIASECEEHSGMHLNVEHLYVEIIKDNGDTANIGEEGNIVVTDLLNTAMPIIRYKVGDIGILSEKKCSCGRGLPLMSKVIGRTADYLKKKDGSKISGISLIENTLTLIPGIKQMQIIQKSYDHFQIRLVVNSQYTQESSNLLISYIRKLFDDKSIIQIQRVENIHTSKSGKYRFSICEISNIYE